jgi:serine/threonine-protein kinase
VQTVGRYQILDKLGQGGMGAVYKAYDPLIERVVAVKVISTQLDLHPEWRDRFFREARAAGQLSHPNIITIYDLGEEDGQPYLAMEYLEGRDLDRRMRGSDAMTVPRKLEIAMAVCDGLAHAHEMGIVHRDVKPANVFVTDSGHVKVLDFGLARVLTSDLTHSHVMLGTMNYMAPEQIRGEKIDQRVDIFSVGVLCYELLCGRKAFHSDSFAATMYQILQHEPEPVERLNPNLPPQLSLIVGRAMEKSREDRYQHVSDLRHDLDLVYEQLRSGVPRSGRHDLAGAPGVRPPSDPRVAADLSNAPTMAGVLTPSLDAPRRDSGSGSGRRPRSGSGSGMRDDIGSAPTIMSEPASPEPRRSVPTLAVAGAVLAVAIVVAIAWAVAGRGDRDRSVSNQASPAPAASEPAPVPPAPAPPEQTAPPTQEATASAPDSPEPQEPAKPQAPRASRQPQSTASSPDGSREALQAAAQAFESVTAARAAAVAQRASDLAPEAWAAATQEETRARQHYNAGRYTAATSQLYAAAGLFRTAEGVARNASAAAAAENEKRARAAEAASQPIPQPAPLPPAAPAPRSQPAEVARPPAVPVPTAPPGPPPEQAVLAGLRRYVAALERRDMAALKAVWPGLTGREQSAIQDDFSNARRISVEFGSPKIQVNGGTAIVSGRRRYEVETRDGHHLQYDTNTTLMFRNAGGTWQIESVHHQAVR